MDKENHNPQIIFRTDANQTLGFGHVMRCLSLAQALRKMNVRCGFVSADRTMEMAIVNSGFSFYALNTHWNDMDGELAVLLPALQNWCPALIVLDSYYATPLWMETVREQCPLVYIDDLNKFRYKVDAVINYNLCGLDWNYKSEYENTAVKLMLGPEYTPLRAEFADIPKRVQGAAIKNILVSTGGADPENVAVQLMQMVAENEQWQMAQFHFVVGPLNPQLSLLKEKAQTLPNVLLHANVQQMSELMCLCDVAIAAAGSTLYELCACGIPAITYILADNQKPGAAAFAARGLMLNAGDCRGDLQFADRVAQCLKELDEPEKRQTMATKMQSLVDGKGAERLAEEILQILPFNKKNGLK